MTLTKILDVHGKVEEELAAVASTLISAGRDVVAAERGDGWVPSEGSESDWAAELIGEMRRTATISAHRALDRDLAHQLDDYLRKATD